MHVLVVEDEKKTHEYLKKGLMENGFVVDVAVTQIGEIRRELQTRSLR